MDEAREIIELSAPYVGYVLPAVILFSIVAVAEYMFDFIYSIIARSKKKFRLS